MRILTLTSRKPKALNMWLITTMFAFVQFFLQIIYAAMSDQVMTSFHIGTALTGLLSSTFFYTFIALQIPAGIILDRFNIRHVISISAAICGIGCIIFGLAPNFHIAIIGRLLMGVGGSFGFLGMIRVVRLWYKSNKFSLMVGMSELLANLAAAFGIGIATFFIVKFGWRGNMISFGLLTLLISLLAHLYLRQPEKARRLRTYKLSSWKQLLMVMRKPQCWLVCLYILGTGAIINAFCGLWGLPFLSSIYGFSHEMSGIGIAIVFIGLAIGCPIMGIIVKAIGQVKKIMIIGSFASVVIMTAIIFPLGHYNPQSVFLLLFLLGLFGSCYFLAFEKMKHLVHESVQGIAMALCNMSMMISALIFQPLIGFILQTEHAQKHHISGPSVYTAVEYQHALIVLILVLLMSLISAIYITPNNKHSSQ